VRGWHFPCSYVVYESKRWALSTKKEYRYPIGYEAGLMTVSVWMLPRVEPRSSRMWLVALRTETFRLHAHQSSNENNHKTAHGTATHVLQPMLHSLYTVLSVMLRHGEFECRPGHCILHSTSFIILRSTVLLFSQRWLEEHSRDLKAFLLPGSKS
jgi:hypothetical protein